MQCAKAQHTPKRPFAAPATTRRDGDRTRDVVLVIVHNQSQGAVEEVFNKLTEAGLAADESFRAADDVVAVGKQASYVCGRVGCHVEDVPDIFG